MSLSKIYIYTFMKTYRIFTAALLIRAPNWRQLRISTNKKTAKFINKILQSNLKKIRNLCHNYFCFCASFVLSWKFESTCWPYTDQAVYFNKHAFSVPGPLPFASRHKAHNHFITHCQQAIWIIWKQTLFYLLKYWGFSLSYWLLTGICRTFCKFGLIGRF